MSYIKKIIGSSSSVKPGQNAAPCAQVIPSSQLPPLSAVILIQNWYRRYQAQLEARRRCTWMVYQSLEYSSEQDMIKLQTLFTELLSLADSTKSDKTVTMLKKIRQISDEQVVEQELWDLDHDHSITKVESKYTGPRIKFPLTTACVHEMFTKFQAGHKLHIRYLLQLLKQAREQLILQPNIQRASSSISRKITVVGDLHGNLNDFATILYKNGVPDVMNPYVFNGDYVDRGGFSVEVFCLVLAYFLLNPTAVFINRGNHEDHFMNCSYGFIKELQKKYKANAERVVRCFADLFRWLPLATIIDEKIFVCHGGISDSVDLKLLEQIPRRKFLSLLDNRQLLNKDPKKRDIEFNQLLDILWSDPKPQPGCTPNEFRGGGCYFGPDTTEAFLKKNKLSLLIRSHECKQEGYEWEHDQRVLTIFSVSNYYSEGSNKGAYVTLDENQTPHIVQYVAQPLAKASAAAKTLQMLNRSNSQANSNHHKVTSVEELALRDLRNKITSCKYDLMKEFLRIDVSQCGYISVTQWCNTLERVLRLKLPWRTLKNRLVAVNKDGSLVQYVTMFDRVQFGSNSNNSSQGSSSTSLVNSGVAEEIYKHRDNLEAIFRMIDSDSSGKLSVEEFCLACRQLCQREDSGLANLSDEDLRSMAKTLDLDRDGQIDFNDFLESFRIVDSQTKLMSASHFK